jgi:asparagine synthase (glutamine-hydrolysing)
MRSLYGWLTAQRSREENFRLGERVGGLLSRAASPPARWEAGECSLVGLAGRGRGEVGHAGDVTAAFSGRPLWSGGYIARFGREAVAAADCAAAYRKEGASFIEHLRGAFTLAIVDQRSGEVLLSVDRMGIGSLAYTQTATGLVFGSTADAIRAHPDAGVQVDPQGIFNYVYFHMVPGPGTVYMGMFRLEPGHYAVFRQGRVRTVPYWRPEYRETDHQAFGELKGELRKHLREGVRRACEGRQRVGAFLSGGTDSSTIAGILTEVTGRPAKTYSIGFAAEGYDEMGYARIAARHFGTEHHEYYVTPDDVLTAIPDIARAYDQPYGNSSAVPTYYCARLASEDGVDALMGGDGGDELFGGNARYAKQQLFDVYGRIPQALRRTLVEPLLFSTPMIGRIPPLRKVRSYVEQASIPMPQRMETYNFLHRFGADAVFGADFLATVDQHAPINLLSHIYNEVHARTLLNRMLAVDLRITLADNDLPKVTQMCDLAGVEAVFPMLDEELVAFSIRLPSRLKLKGTRLRYFFKEALRDFLPDQIITKRKHGFGLPFGVWVQSHAPLQALVRDALGALKSRRIFRIDFVDSMINKFLPQHPAYYGTMIWVMMMLELWYQSHVDGRPG